MRGESLPIKGNFLFAQCPPNPAAESFQYGRTGYSHPPKVAKRSNAIDRDCHRSKSYQKHEHGNGQNNLANNKNVNDLLSTLNNKSSFGNNSSMNYNSKNPQMNSSNLYNQLNQLFSLDANNNNNKNAPNVNNINNIINNNNNTSNITNQNINNNINQNQLLALSNLIN